MILATANEERVQRESDRPHGTFGSTRHLALQLIAGCIILVACVLRFLHLGDDFPNNSLWAIDQAKFTDEGWYSDGAIRHAFSGHWFLRGDFNPAAAVPVWPAQLALVFHFTGVSLSAARALSVAFSVATLVLVWLLVSRYSARPATATLCVLLAAVSPFGYAFSRLATLESSMIFQFWLLMLLAPILVQSPSRLGGGWGASIFRAFSAWIYGGRKPRAIYPTEQRTARRVPRSPWAVMERAVGPEGRDLYIGARTAPAWRVALALTVVSLLIAAMLLTKTTAIVFLPAVFWMYWSGMGRSRSGFVRAVLAVGVLPALWFAAYALLVRRLGYGADFAYFFELNGMPDIDWRLAPATVLALLRNGFWVDRMLYPLSAVVLVWSLVWRRSLWRNPLFAAAWIALGTQAVFLFTRQDDAGPRYFLGMLIPMVIVVGLAIDTLRAALLRALAYSAVAVVAAVNIVTLISFQRHREHQLLDAGLSIRRIVDANPAQKRMMLGVSASEMSLITGVPSLNDYFGTEELAPKLQQYAPGWYLAWMGPDPDNAAAFAPYRLEEVARYRVFDNADRSTLVLYRLVPKSAFAAR